MIAETNNHTTTATTTNSPLSQFAFPRTGKRGVPQQFPRRLYEMLDGETSNAASDARHPKLIVWSNSGKAFRIHNVTEFSSVVLPKYFRTHKFSSFQRNLNLYGFTKVRKGADTDMYAHPSFLRDNPKALLNLQKTTSKNKRDFVSETPSIIPPRPVSPSLSHTIEDTHDAKTTPARSPSKMKSNIPVSRKITIPKQNHRWGSQIDMVQRPTPVSPTRPQRVVSTCSNDCDSNSTRSHDRGKLDLLAFALEQEIACYHVH